MKVLDAEVPISLWSVALFVTGAVVTVAMGRRSAAWLYWNTVATHAAMIWGALVVALTLAPGDDSDASGLTACLPSSGADLVGHLHTSGGSTGALVLNGLLLLPLVPALKLAGARTLTSVAVAVMLPVVIELVQSVVPGRVCSVTDAGVNVLGAVVGLLVGVVLLRCWTPTRAPVAAETSASRSR